MNRSVRVSPRSFLIAGMTAAVVGAAVVTPVSGPASKPQRFTTAVELTSIASGLQGFVDGIEGIFTNLNAFATGIQATIDHILSLPDGVQASIKKAYNTTEAWPAYAAAWAQFSLGLLPGLWWVAPSIPLAYNTVEPLIRAGVYSAADVIGLDPGQFISDIRGGIKASSDNAELYRKAWADSFVLVPTLPPYPGPPPSSSDYVPGALPAASAADVAAPQAAATGGIENAIKNTYNAVEPWVAWGMQWTNYVLGLVPIANWFTPAIPLIYYTIEPLVRAGTYSFADFVGLNFAQIGPDISTGIKTSVNNAITYFLNWANIPLPPKPPAAAVASPAASAPAAVAATDTAAPVTATAAETGAAPAAVEVKTAVTGSAPKSEDLPPVEAPTETTAPKPVDVPESVTASPAAEAPAAAETPKPSRGAQLGHRSPVSGKAGATENGGDSATAERSGRSAG